MVLHPKQPKTTLLIATTTVIDALICRVVSPSTHEPIAFIDAYKFKVWHSVMCEKIQALHANET